jgi:hypothetical protein
MSPEAIAFLDPGADITIEVSGANPAVGGQLAGIPIAPNPGGSAGISDLGDGLVKAPRATTAGQWCLGVFSHDAPVGGRVDVMRAPKVVPCECSAAVAAGAEVMAAADGRITTFAAGAAVQPIGRNIGPATTAAGQFAKVLLYSMGSTQNA